MPTEVPALVGDTTEWIGLVIAAVTCVSLLIGLLWKAFKIHDQIGDMAKELRPNHGSSLRDAVDAVRALAEDHTSHIAQIETAATRVAELNEREISAINRRIDGLFSLISGGHLADQRRLAEWHKSQRTEEG